ncbi:MAG: NUDIX domain-containing protein [Micromonosporaceae bacterium]|nr:NUDIX domain-containing protein [Micromonosporaceae bacterium]
MAAVVTGEDGRLLVVRRRDNGQWQIPGGVLELDESIQDGLRREVEEETGVRVEPVRLTGVYKNLRRGTVALVFRARPVAGRAEPTEESAAVAWWTAAQAQSRMSTTFAVRVRDALSGDEVAVRLHDSAQ